MQKYRKVSEGTIASALILEYTTIAVNDVTTRGIPAKKKDTGLILNRGTFGT